MNEQLPEQRTIDLKNGLECKHFHYEGVLLGSGSDGRVIQVEHELDKNKYAIKIMRLRQDEDGKYSLNSAQKQELKILSSPELCRQNIVKYNYCFDMFICGNPYMSIQMEFCGVTLNKFVFDDKVGGTDFINNIGPLQFCEHVFPQILNGLAAMHKIGWKHGDIHGDNILIRNPHSRPIYHYSECNCVKIADFGLASEVGQSVNELRDYYYKNDILKAGEVMKFVYNHLNRQPSPHNYDNKLPGLIKLLLTKNPTAKQALEYCHKIIRSKEPTESSDAAKHDVTELDRDVSSGVL